MIKSLDAFSVPTSIKLALSWTSLMFLYIYNDYFSLYVHGTVEGMVAGRMGPLGEATPSVLTGVSLMLAVPALMIALSVLLPPRAGRWLNILLGLVYTGVEGLTLLGAPLFYQIVVVFEILLTISIVWHAAYWPRRVEPA